MNRLIAVSIAIFCTGYAGILIAFFLANLEVICREYLPVIAMSVPVLGAATALYAVVLIVLDAFELIVIDPNRREY